MKGWREPAKDGSGDAILIHWSEPGLTWPLRAPAGSGGLSFDAAAGETAA